MTRKFLIGGGLLSTATIAAAVAFAAPGGAAFGPITKADTNSDGTLSKAEVTAMAETRFAKMDANSDGRIDAADRIARQKAKFAEMDADRNGSVTEAEFLAERAGRMAKRERGRDDMAKGGRKGGGYHRGGGAMAMLKMADTNADSAVTKVEMTTAIDTYFAKVDTDGNGQISTAEGQAARQAMRAAMKAQTGN